ncbi:MAG: hypothetical protein LYZ69_05145 [Nitrososphaerales archaeon]|nr:hypothetical protein [Nitrososphaerales archaeon]
MPAGSPLGEDAEVYDDELLHEISGGFSDRISVFPLVGDIIRALGGLLRRRKELDAETLVNLTVETVTTNKLIAREDVARLTRISAVTNNNLVPFMNGGPAGEYWDTARNGFYEWIDRSNESIIGIELGFKADDYGLEVSTRLINKKKADPDVSITLLIDGFVSIIMQKPSTDFEKNTVDMILDMRKVGIDVRINDSPNPLSSDFFAANHIKLWIFDGEAAFFGGVGIETQFRKILYDEMDLVQGPFVRTLNMIALLLLANQKSALIDPTRTQEINELPKEKILSLFAKDLPIAGSVTLKLSINVPGYVQDARKEYADLLSRDDLEEVYIIAPYFSDEKIARALMRAAKRLSKKPRSGTELQGDKRIHIVFPTKQENRMIADISKYYAYRLRNNPVVDTRQLFVQTDSGTFNMLHAKQMVVVLMDRSRNWTKYVKFGGSYNPAGKGQHMWELNATAYNGSWEMSDEGPAAPASNQIRDYLDEVMKVVVDRYSVPFPWGEAGVKLSLWERFVMNLAETFWFLT